LFHPDKRPSRLPISLTTFLSSGVFHVAKLDPDLETLSRTACSFSHSYWTIVFYNPRRWRSHPALMGGLKFLGLNRVYLPRSLASQLWRRLTRSTSTRFKKECQVILFPQKEIAECNTSRPICGRCQDISFGQETELIRSLRVGVRLAVAASIAKLPRTLDAAEIQLELQQWQLMPKQERGLRASC